MHSLMQVPRAAERLATLAARHEAPEALREAVRTLDAHRAAAAEVCASGTLAAALAAALRAGNFLNFGGRQGGATGFRLRSLGTLAVCNPDPTHTYMLHSCYSPGACFGEFRCPGRMRGACRRALP